MKNSTMTSKQFCDVPFFLRESTESMKKYDPLNRQVKSQNTHKAQRQERFYYCYNITLFAFKTSESFRGSFSVFNFNSFILKNKCHT